MNNSNNNININDRISQWSVKINLITTSKAINNIKNLAEQFE